MSGLELKCGKAFASFELYKYLVDHSYRANKHLDELREVSVKHEWGGMCSPPDSIPLLQLLVQLLHAKKIAEVGVFTGKPFWKAAGVQDKVDLRLAPAAETLKGFLQNGEEGTFDMGFIDADKTGYDVYYELLLKLLRPGGVILIDNTLWDGNVIKPEVQTADTLAIRAINDKVLKDDRVTICMLPISDGVTIALKK
ncbi:O-methyltransferase [Coccomyxa subellipsoidea C-169]|uniref:O-methyltransferase n=1 Tax=Coccomyxa subellipsoidea (strain C-169) TaxID=574566 RepID=I0YPC4_COCSC|nr:O-methyltransferase [Coccomyxa subellipsoidea C-169]EIE20243.1 O-methyltransferase [Coccomyxa subellipsoidea C-169]|eukprot:XP_005644787.1 O-methyltransferase [Coccomyxa subellipsoidea C-169]